MKNIDIAFSFDKNFIQQAKVTIASLLWASKKEVHYNIYCICDQNVKNYEKKIIKFILKRDPLSCVKFCYHEKQFSQAFQVRNINTTTYYRLLLHKMLPKVDKIIYSDTDVVFYRSLKELENFNLGNNLIAGVKASFNIAEKWDKCCKNIPYWKSELGDVKGKYIQAGFLVFNLKEIRKLNIPNETYINMALKKYTYVDQDIINILYKDKLCFLPPKYNFFAPNPLSDYEKMKQEGLYTEDEVDEAIHDFVMCHFAGEKPWNNFKVKNAQKWLDFVRTDQELFDYFLNQKHWQIKLYKKLSFIKKYKNKYLLEKSKYDITKKWKRYNNPSYSIIRKHITEQFIQGCHYYPNIDNPKTFNEKLQWFKLYYRNDLMTICADKYAVRQYVQDKIGKEYLIPIIGVWNNVDDIDFNALPDQFVLKVNWGSGQNIICKNKKELNIYQTKEKLRTWMLNFKNHYYHGYEWGYKNITPKIIAETFIQQVNNDLFDYKLLCYNGKVKNLFVVSDREHNKYVDFYDVNWVRMPFERHYKNSPNGILKPKNLKKMIELAQILSQEFPFARIDFYNINGKIYFGEITFCPGNGVEEFKPSSWDNKLGQFIILPKPNYNNILNYLNKFLFIYEIKKVFYSILKFFSKMQRKI